MPKTNIKVKLIGEDGNAFFILGRIIKELKKNGHDDLAKQFETEATSGDFNNLLATAMEYVEVV